MTTTQRDDPMPAPRSVLKPTLVAAALLTLGACATAPTEERLPFSDSLIRDYGLGESHKRRLQYYTAERIVLTRAAGSSLRGLNQGKLIDRGSTRTRGVDIPAGTPGVVVGSGPNWLAVSFAPDSYLYFVSSQHAVNSPYWRDRRDAERYYLYAPDWDGRAGTVQLGPVAYQAVEGSIDSYLLVDREALFDAESQSSTLSGRWLEGLKR